MRDLPGPARDGVHGVIAEFEEQRSLEAFCARNADTLECLLQARASAQGVEPWIASSLTSLRTETGRRLGREALETDPAAWWDDAVVAAQANRTA